MKKIFGFFSSKNGAKSSSGKQGSKFFKLFVIFAIIGVVVLSSMLVSKFVKNKDINLNALSKSLNTYDIELVYNSNNSFTAKQVFNYTNNTGQELPNLNFNLYASAFADGVISKPVSTVKVAEAYPNGLSYGGIKVESVKIAGNDAIFEVQGTDKNVLQVAFPSKLKQNSKIKVEMEYSFALPNIHHRFGYGANTINVGNFYPVLGVFENGEWVCTPYHYNGDPFYSEMSNYNVSLKVPNNMKVAHTGALVSSTDNADNTKTLKMNAKVVRDFAFVMSEKFEVLEGKAGNTTVSYFYYSDENPQKSLQAGIDAVNTFSEMFGQYPYDTYTICETNFVHGGMEYPNLVYISDDIASAEDYVNVIVHETAHQWWYQMVGSNAYNYPWVDEGLTEFVTVLFYEKNPSYNVNSQEIIASANKSYISFIELCEEVLGTTNTSMNRALNEYETEPEYVYITYVKGMLLFSELRDIVGDKTFEKALKTYVSEYKFQNVTDAEIINVFEKTSKTSLKPFFDSWIEGRVVINNFGNKTKTPKS